MNLTNLLGFYWGPGYTDKPTNFRGLYWGPGYTDKPNNFLGLYRGSGYTDKPTNLQLPSSNLQESSGLPKTSTADIYRNDIQNLNFVP